jgi:hypothetical protein
LTPGLSAPTSKQQQLARGPASAAGNKNQQLEVKHLNAALKLESSLLAALCQASERSVAAWIISSWQQQSAAWSQAFERSVAACDSSQLETTNQQLEVKLLNAAFAAWLIAAGSKKSMLAVPFL